MLNRELHQLMMGNILKDIYTDVSISSLLGFKGGTCARYFYDLPRFSVDLDFDLLVDDEEVQKLVMEKVVKILSKYGQIKEQYIKRFTVFALLSYGKDDHNIKIEINHRIKKENVKDYFELRDLMGISMLISKKDYMFANKLVALTSRSGTVMRDIFDVHYFAKSRWDINKEVIEEITGKTTKTYLADCVEFLEKVKNDQILQGLGELVDGEKEKDWIRNHLKLDTIFQLKNYMSVLK